MLHNGSASVFQTEGGSSILPIRSQSIGLNNLCRDRIYEPTVFQQWSEGIQANGFHD